MKMQIENIKIEGVKLEIHSAHTLPDGLTLRPIWVIGNMGGRVKKFYNRPNEEDLISTIKLAIDWAKKNTISLNPTGIMPCESLSNYR